MHDSWLLHERTFRSSSSGATTMLEKKTIFLSSLAPSSLLRFMRARDTKPRNALPTAQLLGQHTTQQAVPSEPPSKHKHSCQLQHRTRTCSNIGYLQ